MKNPLHILFLLLLIIPLLSFSPYKAIVHGTLLKDTALYHSLKEENKNVELLKEMIVLPDEAFDSFEATEMVLTLANIAPRILTKIVDEGIVVKFFTGKLTDEPSASYLRGLTPRGYFSGTTWDDVPGLGGDRIVLVKIGHSEYGKGHGSVNLELHEIAHSIDRLVFDGIRTSEEFIQIWREEAHVLFPKNYYFIEYPEEYFAEAFALYYVRDDTREYLRSVAPKTFQYIRNLEK